VEIRFGTLLFFGETATTPTGISHIAFALDGKLMLEAGGGGSTTTSLEAAIKQGAFVRIRPISRRRDLRATATLAAIGMMPPEHRALLRTYAESLIGSAYRWGGNGPHFDCSGLVLELLNAFGLWKGGDTTSGQILATLRASPQTATVQEA
jgi:cell wall-associated NlpC family hydrolase